VNVAAWLNRLGLEQYEQAFRENDGGGAGANWRNFLVQGEFYQINVTQSKLPHVPAPMLGFDGGYVEGSVVLTGEPHPYAVFGGARSKLRPGQSSLRR